MKILEEWRISTIIPLYRNKGDIENYYNCRDIKLLRHTMKLMERVIKKRLRRDIPTFGNQFDFMAGRLIIKAFYLT